MPYISSLDHKTQVEAVYVLANGPKKLKSTLVVLHQNYPFSYTPQYLIQTHAYKNDENKPRFEIGRPNAQAPDQTAPLGGIRKVKDTEYNVEWATESTIVKKAHGIGLHRYHFDVPRGFGSMEWRRCETLANVDMELFDARGTLLARVSDGMPAMDLIEICVPCDALVQDTIILTLFAASEMHEADKRTSAKHQAMQDKVIKSAFKTATSDLINNS